MLGSIIPRLRRGFLGAGAAVASLALVLLAARLSAPFGRPSQFQIAALIGAIIFEILAIRLAIARYRDAGERALLLAILLAVGLHFLPMGLAFGPLCTGLGIALSISAGVGLWLARSLPLNAMWAVDGVMKIAFGAAMMGVSW